MMIARLKCHVESGPGDRAPGIQNRLHFGMGSSAPVMITLAEYLSGANQHCSDHRVGTHPACPSACQADRPLHVFFLFRHKKTGPV